MEKFNELKSLLEGLESDADKFFNKGNSAAGTRVRKGLQELKNLSQDLRLKIQEAKNAGK
ncbi:histone H1 [Albibacterium indicum]|uniref:histone H1 n=1 Tax=Albibacterium indicum TaxID=2292082 RepID=UPI000E4C58F5|nr:histone H1 [Pedobacter indicus]